jgi:hypothetical protein
MRWPRVISIRKLFIAGRAEMRRKLEEIRHKKYTWVG